MTIHRGTHEIGGTCIELKNGSGERLILDLGQPLASLAADLDGLELSTEVALQMGLLPHVPGLYQGEDAPRPLGVFLSHLHLDHIGLIHHVHPEVPIFMGPRSPVLHRSLRGILPHSVPLDHLRIEAYGDAPIQLGAFQITPYLVDHSAFEAFALLVEADGKRVFYSGDFRSHGRKHVLYDRLCAIPPKDIDLLLMEGTTLGRPEERQPTEAEIEDEIAGLLKNNPHHALVAYSPQNLDRHVTLIRAAKRSGRKFYVDAYGAWCHEAFLALGVKLPKLGKGEDEVGVLLGSERWLKNPEFEPFENRLVKGIASKYDPALSQPALISFRHHVGKRLKARSEQLKGGYFLYSMWMGYLKKSTTIQDFVASCGMELRHAHTSGHADGEALKRLHQALKPRITCPVHTEHPEAYTALLPGASLLFLQDGQTWKLPGT